MRVRKVDSDAIKLYESSQVKFKTTGTIREVQFTAGVNKSCSIQNISKDTYLDKTTKEKGIAYTAGYLGTELMSGAAIAQVGKLGKVGKLSGVADDIVDVSKAGKIVNKDRKLGQIIEKWYSKGKSTGSEALEGSKRTNTNRYCLSGNEHFEAYKEMFGAENVEWTSRDTLSRADRLRIQDWAYPPTDELYLKNKNVYQNDLYFNQATGDIRWPLDDGFAEYPETIMLQPGTIIDRYGSDYGTFTSPVGTPYEKRALAPGTELKPYSVFEVTKPIEVHAGKIAPWFDQPGGGYAICIARCG